MKSLPTIMIIRGAVIAALYVALTMPFASFAYGPVQFRISEALTILPLFFPEAIFGLTVGCLISNIIGGPIDMLIGTLSTLVAAFLTYKLKNIWLGVLPPIIINALTVPLIFLFAGSSESYFINMLTVGAGQSAVILGLGIPLCFILKRLIQKGIIKPDHGNKNKS